ncbi:hypothetical protein PMI35_06740 [Pseudomonas sp. GM78]|uniref:hypothetical protein n=1 Tax=Pseudomonas sp. GM78 TaxID=1144337 RepID=UPI000270C9C8|nr:hypothetical protein [Pseudomonas sp. GM78]EJN16476.1 hypothetical protein PMI35_06740 [Pseudomonas sp. GM78]
MDRREEFLEKALAVHREYELATTVMRQMISEKKTYGPEWNLADARQKAALEDWTSLLRNYSDIHKTR